MEKTLLCCFFTYHIFGVFKLKCLNLNFIMNGDFEDHGSLPKIILLNKFPLQSIISRQPAPYTSRCINDWIDTGYDIKTETKYSLAVGLTWKF
jgi:hypothetical protein